MHVRDERRHLRHEGRIHQAAGASRAPVDHSTLSGAALKAKLKQHKIGLLRSKDELVKLLAEKQASLKQVQQLAQQLKKVPAPGGLQDLAVAEFKEMGKAKGISLNMTKQDVIELLEELAEKAKQDAVEIA